VNRVQQFRRDGFVIVPELVAPELCEALATELGSLLAARTDESGRRAGGLRNVLRISPRTAGLARSERIVSLVDPLMELRPFPVRAILFDKTGAANWSIPWHQDLAIAVASRVETPGFGPWSLKEGVFQVKPPTGILAQLVTVRIHLDDCPADNGALQVIPGSHTAGELAADKIEQLVATHSPVICPVPRGGALVMRPLLLHASAPARQPTHRRVLHIEYAGADLPNGLEWAERS
jgi:hypothetical protein